MVGQDGGSDGRRRTPRRTAPLLVASPDRRRVLARPNGLAGWALPRIAVDHERGDDDPDQRDEAVAARAAAQLRVRPSTVTPFGDAFAVEVDGRIPAAGIDWIGRDDVARLGADAALAAAWLESLS